MEMITVIAYAALALTIAAVWLSIAAIGMRVINSRHEARVDHVRSHMLQVLKKFLDGKVGQEDAAREMRKNRKIAIDMLIGVATELPTAERERLHVFFRTLEFDEREHAVLNSRNWLRRARAASELGLAGHRDSVPELLLALDDPTLDVRLAAAHSLAQIKAPEAVVPILHALTLHPHWPVQRAAEILYEMGPCAIAPLIAFLDDHKYAEPPVLVAVRALGMLEAADGAALAVELLRHPDDELRRTAACALGQMGDAAIARTPLIEALSDPVWEVRCMAAQALGRLGDRAAVHPLAHALGDAAWWVRFNAAEALYQLGETGIQAMRQARAQQPEGLVRDICSEVLEEHGLPLAMESAR
ncbi:MAG TPA: HEAT repeat domain-containing protein [Nevskiaceae bacterium]|nr:HEAT repeat domain-containing protein [Nevskiaceae bacterium]